MNNSTGFSFGGDHGRGYGFGESPPTKKEWTNTQKLLEMNIELFKLMNEQSIEDKSRLSNLTNIYNMYKKSEAENSEKDKEIKRLKSLVKGEPSRTRSRKSKPY